MLEAIRNSAAWALQGGPLQFFARRLTKDQRYPGNSRVRTSGRTVAGVHVDADNAVTVAAVWACLRYLSQTVAVLPWHVMKDGTRGAEAQYSNPVDWLLYKRPNPEWSSFQFRETLTHWALRHGNGYAEIERDQADRPYALWPIHPERTTVCRAGEPETAANGRPIAKGEIFYEVNNGVDGVTKIAAKDIFHIRGFGEGPVGVNVIEYAAQSIGWAKAAQIFGASFFGNGATPTTVVLNKTAMSVEGIEEQKAAFEQLYKGPTRAHKTAFLDADADIKTIGLDAEKSQLVVTHQYLVEEICRWFGVPPHKVSHLLRATFSNIEHQAIEVVVDSVSPWVKRFEDEADYKLFGQNRSNLYTKMNMNALLRGDMKSRMEFYKGMHSIGAYSPNRVLELEDENTLGPEGDIRVMQEQYKPLEWIANPPEPAAALPTPASPHDDPPDDEDDDNPEPDESTVAAMQRFNEIMGLEAVE